MDSLQAIALAKKYVGDVYADEHFSNLELEEVEHSLSSGTWNITLAFSRPWSTPRTRTQEMLENLGAAPPSRRAFKIVTLDEDGKVLSMKNRRMDAAE
jgi:hypothetical protein